jgi:hypothetical protein
MNMRQERIILTALVFIALLGTLKLPVQQAEKVTE